MAFLAAYCLLGPVSDASGALAPQTTLLSPITQEVRSPVRMASDQFGNLYVADPTRGGILKHDHSGAFIARFPVKGPRGVAVTPAGDLVVTRGDSASVLDATTGSEKIRLGKGAGQFKQATGVTVDDIGRIYVADSLDNCIQTFNGDGTTASLAVAAVGKPTNSFGTSGSKTGEFSLPTGITFEKLSRQLAVVDTLNSRIQFFTTAGLFVTAIGTRGTGGGPAFTTPQAVTFEYSKDASPTLARLYVVDSFQSEVQVIDPANGAFLSSIGGYGPEPGKLIVPTDALFDPATSRLFVANGQGNITVYGINVTVPPTPDIIPPVLTLSPVPTATSANSLVIGGTVESEAVITIITNTAAVAGAVNLTRQNTALSFWSASITNLTPGANTITVIARDSASNIKILPPATVIFSPAAVKLSIAPVVSPTKNTSQTLSGTMDAGAAITLSADSGATFGPVTNPTPTTWQSTVSGLVEGNNSITVTATTATSAAATTAILTLVTAPPNLELSTLPDLSTTATQLLNVTGFILLNGFFDSVTVNGVPIPVLNNAFSTTLVLAAGVNTIRVQAADKAGNLATDQRTITYDPALQPVTIIAPADGSTVSTIDITLNGTAPAGSTLSLLLYNGSANGLRLSQINQPGSGTSWSTSQPVFLDPGLNTIVVESSDLSGAITRNKITVSRDAAVPALKIDSPTQDLALNVANRSISGTTTPGSTVSATLNGNVVPVTLTSSGSFTVPITMTEEKLYTLAITTTDPLGNAVTSYRSILYDVTAPGLTVNSTNPVRVTFSGGTLTARDKNGPVSGAVVTFNANGSVTIDLTNAIYDAATLNIQAVDAAGNSSRNGDMSGDGKSDITDGLLALRANVGLDAVSAITLLRADVAPLVNGVSTPDGIIDGADVVVILEKIIGLR